ncbi:TetR/AcrR family transcriptional regulator [Catenuloplanes atrovinosus]|uniref:AcrR family transcriptional regulator n=1 Tax=Catenuloplanes atrovinosus TaxID=137266 RepID=A0AAE4C6R4_9ACTN|nr:TetR family transcriptional regulator [Catenuloplanes atrovinosus]MDR7273791.1 AcrR family transcriptional regulator [Catenuloplanes atrovinosus]
MRSAETIEPPRRRPKNRKDQIALVAAELFCAHGYHGVGIDQIAAAVGISGPAVYRHFQGKYAILVYATRRLIERALEAVDADDADPAARLDALLAALARVAVEGRRVGGLYQWEWRYLEPVHVAEFAERLDELMGRFVVPLLAVREDLDKRAASALVRAMFSVFGSLSTHRAAIARGRAEQILHRVGLAVLHGEAPVPRPLTRKPRPDQDLSGVRPGARRELILAEAIRLFHRHGYHAVGMNDIALGVGINASSLYRVFPGKADILAAAFYRASERVAEATAVALDGAADARDALRRMAESYVELTFERSDLVSVYLAENSNLPGGDRHELRKVQRLHVEEWVRLLTGVRPDLPVPEARVLVHAALNLVTDLSRWVRFDRRTGMDAHLVRLAMLIMAA